MSRVRFALLLAAAAAVLSRPVPAGAQESGDKHSASECCTSLLRPVGARVVGLGSAITARAMPDALYVNPAGIAGLNTYEFRVHSERTEIDHTTNFVVTFGLGRTGTAAIGYRLVDFGDSESRDRDDNLVGTVSISDQLATATFATSIVPHVNAGVTYKLFQERYDCRGYCGEPSAAGTTNGIDLGVRVDVPWVSSLQLGMSALQLALPLQVRNAAQRDPAPTRLRVGAAYELLQHFRPDSTMQLVASADLERGIRQGAESRAAAALELVLDRTLFVRSGYATGAGKGSGASVGVGMIWERFDVSVAKSFAASEDGGEPFQVTFAIAF